jgi:hypothetical protein
MTDYRTREIKVTVEVTSMNDSGAGKYSETAYFKCNKDIATIIASGDDLQKMIANVMIGADADLNKGINGVCNAKKRHLRLVKS